MGFTYSPEQLQALRASPLVQKPAGLPPAEEWMGATADAGQRKSLPHPRGRAEAHYIQNDNPQQCPALDSRLSTKSSSGEMVLGPPKTAFASSSALRGTTTADHSSRSAFGSFGSEHRNDLFSKARQGVERGKGDHYEEKQREIRSGLRNVRDESSSWLGRSMKVNGIDVDRNSRGNTTKDNNQETIDGHRRPQARAYDPARKESLRDSEENKRTSRGSRPSWYKDDSVGDSYLRESNSEVPRFRGWRDADRSKGAGLDRDGNRGHKAEQEPEWMGDSTTQEKSSKHNVQDIEQWKATMKARDSANTQPELPGNGHTHKPANSLTGKSTGGLPLSVDPGLDDKFLSFFGEPDAAKSSLEPKTSDDNPGPRMGRPNTKSSKFTGFFGPRTAGTPTETESQSAKSEKPSDPLNDDKAGFQRILQMLGAPQPSLSQTGPKMTATPNEIGSSHQNGSVSTHPARSPPPILSPRSRKSHGLESLLGLQTPQEGSLPMNKDSEFLLNLLRPKDTRADERFLHDEQKQGNEILGVFPPTETISTSVAYRNSSQPTDTDSHLRQHVDEQNLIGKRFLERPQGAQSSLPHHGNALFDDGDDGSVFPPHFTMGIPSHHTNSSAIQRLPGFDQPGPPPGFPPFSSQHQHMHPPHSQHQPQSNHRGLGAVAPPPGFGGPNTRNPNIPPNIHPFPPGLMPNLNSLSLNEHAHTVNGQPSGPGAHLGPPPGFMGPPPPMLPIMGMPQEGFYGHGRPPVNLGDPSQFGVGGRRGGTTTGNSRRQDQ